MPTGKLVTAALLVAVALTVLVVACGDDDDGADLAGTSWVLSTLADAAALAGSEVTASFAEGQVSGSAGCNSYTGTYEADGDEITIGENIAVTARACETPLMEQESAYLIALGQAERVAIDGDELTIDTGAGELLFTR